MKILVTGGAGYIGSHFVKYLLDKNKEIVVFDNLSRGHKESLPKGIIFEEGDLLNTESLKKVFGKYNFDSIVHFAAFAYVGESVEHPEMYYENNVVGSFNLIKTAAENEVKNFVFSSTCSVYGNPKNIPISEDEFTAPINPYAKTKLMIENMLDDFQSSSGMNYAALRYFNAAGADPSSDIGESHDPEPHLIPIVLNTALGERENVFIFGDDYDTEDGTCIRDYIHVNDLADAHLKALEYLQKEQQSLIVNLGTGKGNSVREIIYSSEKITGKKIKSEITPRRKGDPAILVADNKRAKEILNWQPKYNLEDIISSAWNWRKHKKF